ncbi:hypothetical protein ElyMa_001406900 [Elysia marginata]|uniref:Uncharacterized protein n=1 Tax=Elysia marginata TaxID=1093978 RepID=A0AAV4ITR3_9GAST|nr:hypothetical protein ElyMa_001406900 [Elysia marginata]
MSMVEVEVEVEAKVEVGVEVLKLQHLKTSIERVRGSKCYKFNDSTAHKNPETALQDDASDSGSDFHYEKDDFNSSDSEFSAKEKKKLCKKRNRSVRKQVFSDSSCMPLAVLLHKQFQSKMDEKAMDEEP